MKIIGKILAGVCMLFASLSSMAQEALEKYISEGFQQNIVLQRKTVSYDRAVLALKTARSMFGPSVDFEFGYQTAKGGRQIPLPIGDMLNGVYSTLNQLTQSALFPQIDNQTITFLPQNFYDAKVRTSVPIVNTDLIYNKQISERKVVLQEYEVNAYKRELVKSIKSAYYSYLNAMSLLSIRKSSLTLAREGRRVNEKLLENGKGLPAYVLRANSEIAALEAEIVQARQQVNNARLYFNALLNREAEAEIDTVFDTEAHLSVLRASVLTSEVSSGREELKSLAELVNINERVKKMQSQYAVPRINGFVDLGSQAENWKFNGQSRYFMAGLQMAFPVFASNRNKQKIKEAELNIQDSRLQLADTQRQLDMSSRVALNSLKATWEALSASREQLKAAQAYQRLIEKGYSAGSNTYIETVDARSQLTSAQMALSINMFNVLQAAANLERETAGYNINE